jgi:hypothetical protein
VFGVFGGTFLVFDGVWRCSVVKRRTHGKVDLQIVVHGQVNFFYWNEEFGDFKTFSIA